MKITVHHLIIGLFLVVFATYLSSCGKKSTEAASQPTVTTAAVTSITDAGATLGGTVTVDGGSPVTDRGVFLATKANASVYGFAIPLGTGKGDFTVTLDTLRDNKTYFVLAYATNSVATVYGTELSFTTLLKLRVPTVYDQSASSISGTGATVGGNIIADGGASVADRGVWYSTTQTPETGGTKVSMGTSTGAFTAALTGLTSSTTYYYKAYGTNSVGQGLGRLMHFTTPSGTDCLNCVTGTDSGYKTVTIGTQVWMSENLKVAAFSNGQNIPTTSYSANITAEATPTYQWSTTCDGSNTYGLLYTWFAVTDARGLCPSGWHIPSQAEFQTLSDYLGGKDLSGGKMKTIGTTAVGDGLFLEPNSGATNESGFSAGPNTYFDAGGGNNCDDTAHNPNGGGWWTTTETSATHATVWNVDVTTSQSYPTDATKTFGLAVRCVKN